MGAPRAVGITSTIPLEIPWAAGRRVVDLNNRFISHPRRERLLEEAEREGFPASCCAWIKGIWRVALSEPLEEVIGVTQGDCSNTHALLEQLQARGVRVVYFNYPWPPSREEMLRSLRRLMEHYGVGEAEVARAKERLDRIRRKLVRLDELTWREDRVSGEENHRFLVTASDMAGDPERFEAELDAFLREAAARPPRPPRLRLAYIGVPPIFDDLYAFLEERGARVVFNEVQRQFAMPYGCADLAEQYLRYTYPYGAQARLADIRAEAARRGVQGIIHYVQAFCFRGIYDSLFRRELPWPVLTLEGDRPGRLDARTRVRLEAFLEMLGA